MPQTRSPEELYKSIRQGLSGFAHGEDRSGRTPLQSLADDLSAPRSINDREIFSNVAQRLVDEIPELSDQESASLVKFLVSAGAPLALVRRASRVLKQLDPERAPSKRADVIWLLYRLGNRFPPKQIRTEVAVRNARPWMWLDLAIETDPAIATDALSGLADKPNFFRAVLSRIMQIWRNTNAEEFANFTSALYAELGDSERTQVEQLLTGCGVRFARPRREDLAADFDKLAERVSERVPSALDLSPVAI